MWPFKKHRYERAKMRVSIATKLILATLVLVTSAAVPLAYQSSRYFEAVSQKKEEDTNLSVAIARATETESVFQALLEKSRTIGSLYHLHLKAGSADLLASIETLLDNDRDIFAVDVYRSDDGGIFRLEQTLIKRGEFDGKQADETSVERIRLKNPFPIASVAQGQIEIMPAAVESEIPLMAFGAPVSRNQLGQIDGLTVTYFRLARLQRAFSRESAGTVFLVDSRGQVLAHPDEELVLGAASLSSHPVVGRSLGEANPRGQLPFTDTVTQAPARGAYARTSFGPVVISQVDDAYILAPSREARRQSIFIVGIILSISLFVVFLFSMTFSSPIEKLASLIREVSKGNLEVNAKAAVITRDELGYLARVFDDMVTGLKERAKAYAVMRQALGSSVIETLMEMKEEELGGQRKPITVLFSDLRDFTKFSEGHTPEEVVTMLNEYFDVMVKVIAKHGGWLDKFIGDAIMAVWGVPNTGEDDAVLAVRAALEMRTALNELNEKRAARGQGPCKIGIGLHFGDAIVGKIGATERANLTVIGDTVNMASRIEASTKAFGTDILLSHELVELLGQKFVIEQAGQAEVKGKSEPLKLYKLRGFLTEDGSAVIVKTPYSDYEAEAADKVKVA
jgi:adenylate cyclase